MLAAEPAAGGLRRAPRRARAGPTATACSRGASRSAVRARPRAVVAGRARPRRAATRARRRCSAGTTSPRSRRPRPITCASSATSLAARAGEASAATLLEFWIEADTFMRHMNRVLVGTMLEVARGRRTLEDFAALLDGPPARAGGRDRAGARPGAGLGRCADRRLTPIAAAGAELAALCWRRRCCNVLLTNDDGIEAEGLQALRAALAALDGRAPRRDRARRQPLGDGALDHDAPAAVGRRGRRSPTARSATPPTARRSTACASRASAWSRTSRPTSSSSGINHGANLGDDITYSGTVAAALEGVVLGHPGDRRLPAVARRRARLHASTAASTSTSRRRSSRGWWSGIEDVAAAAERRC